MSESDELFIAGKAEYFRGNLDHAIACFEKSLALSQISPQSHNNLLLTSNYLPDYSPEQILAMHREFDALHCQPLACQLKPHANPVDAKRRIKIGYVSPDFKAHPVAYFILPVLMHHNPEQFEVFCYHNFPKSDDITNNLRKYCHHWRQIVRSSDEQVAELIRQDQIDILVDLAGHSGGNRLLVFARKPAPVQVTWLGYPNTTGLAAIDFRLTDAWTDPPGVSDPYCTEKLVRLPNFFSCYSPPQKCPEISPAPATKHGVVTFASLNNFSKINHGVIALWARLLHEVPRSRLLITYNGGGKLWFDRQLTRARCSADVPVGDLRGLSNLQFAQNTFVAQGLLGNRVQFLGPTLSHFNHLQNFQNIDIALDPFPYNGTTTTFESLWMGIPVITLAGERHAARVSSSILQHLGLAECIASSHEGYIAAAKELAGNPGKLVALRTTLRSIMSKSSLMNAKEFTAGLEAAYRSMWEDWCQKQAVVLPLE